MALNRGRNTNDYHDYRCHGNQVGHSSRWGWALNEWQSHWHSHGEAPWSQWDLDLRQHKGTPMPWKHPKLWTGKDIKGLIMSDFPYVRLSLHQNASHIKVKIWSVSVLLIKVVSKWSERQKRLFLCLPHFKLTPFHQREKRLEKLSNFEIVVWSFLSQYSQLHQEPDQLSHTCSWDRKRYFWLTTWQMQFNNKDRRV